MTEIILDQKMTPAPQIEISRNLRDLPSILPTQLTKLTQLNRRRSRLITRQSPLFSPLLNVIMQHLNIATSRDLPARDRVGYKT